MYSLLHVQRNCNCIPFLVIKVVHIIGHSCVYLYLCPVYCSYAGTFCCYFYFVMIVLAVVKKQRLTWRLNLHAAFSFYHQ